LLKIVVLDDRRFTGSGYIPHHLIQRYISTVSFRIQNDEIRIGPDDKRAKSARELDRIWVTFLVRIVNRNGVGSLTNGFESVETRRV
jgi:hypothetical protein